MLEIRHPVRALDAVTGAVMVTVSKRDETRPLKLLMVMVRADLSPVQRVRNSNKCASLGRVQTTNASSLSTRHCTLLFHFRMLPTGAPAFARYKASRSVWFRPVVAQALAMLISGAQVTTIRDGIEKVGVVARAVPSERLDLGRVPQGPV